jgi:hypothetical protein
VNRRLFHRLLAVVAFALWLAACQAAISTEQPSDVTAMVPSPPAAEVTQAPATEAPGIATGQPAPTPTPPAGPTAGAATPPPAGTPRAVTESRVVEVEWPPVMRLGESDVVRLSLVPHDEGYVVTTEFGEHQTITQTVAVVRPPGLELLALARLDAAGFELEPSAEQMRRLPPSQPVTWRWSLQPEGPGQHRLILSLRLRWVSTRNPAVAVQEVALYDRALTIQVRSLFGLTAREVMALGVAGVAFGSTLSLPLAAHWLRGARRPPLQVLKPNPAVAIERPPGLALNPAETELLSALFARYQRLVLTAEFHSGYSGARTLLARPVQPGGQADAPAIVKLGDVDAIQQEYRNYETYVKVTLPPVTARIQAPPVRAAPHAGLPSRLAALRYTFLGAPGQPPLSLREALLAEPDPARLEQLFATFGPNWWMQRRPYTFVLGLEYDRLLPAHYVLEPAGAERPTTVLDGRQPASAARLTPGQVVRLTHLRVAARRPDRLSLHGSPPAGQLPLRLRWLSQAAPEGAAARVVATRAGLLRDLSRDFAHPDLPDPLGLVDDLLGQVVAGTRSTIHGDLNLENVLVGPGNLVWLIDFAQTREGHPLFDFAHLHAAILGQVVAPRLASPASLPALLADGAGSPLLAAMQSLAARCLFNPAEPREYALALFMACVGALKYATLDTHQKHYLYLSAAHLARAL